MPPTADTLQAIEVGVLALQHEVSRAMRRVADGDRSIDALVSLAFSCSELAALLHLLAVELREARRVTAGP